MSHNHSHGHGHDHGHDHDHDDHGQPSEHEYQTTPEKLLYEQIDFPKIITLNESEPRSGAAILQKTWAQRLDGEPELQSDADEQLLMTIPFTGQVRLQSVLLRTSNSDSAPSSVKMFVNRDDLDFAVAEELEATQSLELARTGELLEHGVRRALFNSTRSLTLFFPGNFGDGDEDVTRVSYLAFKGDFMKLGKEPVSVLYEAAANPADHAPIVGTKVGMDGALGGRGGDGI